MATGIFVIAELRGAVAEHVLEVQRRFDPRLAASAPPHVTITGSSGVGPIPLSTTERELREALEPVVRTTPPLELRFGAPTRFMQTNYVVLPLDPHGAIRVLHDRIATSGLRFGQARFTFTPHCTLSFYRELPRPTLRELLAVHVPGPVLLDRLQLYRATEALGLTKILELELEGAEQE